VTAYRQAEVIGRCCPRDGSILVAGKRGPLDLLDCETCGGTFVPRGRLLRDPRFLRETRLASPPAMSVPTADDSPALRCPKCWVHMHRVRLLGVFVDDCASHGIWFDRDELSVLLDRWDKLANSPEQVRVVRPPPFVEGWVVALAVTALVIGGAFAASIT
jgi:Zn-finger nucleic acid-binding protein